jgi:ferrous iron transport protein A
MSSPAPETVPLSALMPGERAIVRSARQLSPAVFRLIELGLTPGAEVEMVRRAPLGGPLQVRVRRSRICLRRPDAACFELERLP